MAYDARLAQRLKKMISGRDDFHAQKMFGGIGFLLRGNMCFGVYKEYLILRLGKDAAVGALKKKDTKPFDITGRAMSGWVMVGAKGTASPAALKKWATQAIDFVSTLPRK